MSISIDELSSVYGMYGVNGLTANNNQITAADSDKKATDGDSYISTIAGMDPNAAIPSENYNDLGRKLKAAAQTGETASSTEYASVTNTASVSAQETSAASAQGTSSAGGSGGSGDSGSDSDEDTETEVVTINGQTFLQTTTTDSSGNVTVTRVPIGVTPVNNDGSAASSGPSAAAQALASL